MSTWWPRKQSEAAVRVRGSGEAAGAHTLQWVLLVVHTLRTAHFHTPLRCARESSGVTFVLVVSGRVRVSRVVLVGSRGYYSGSSSSSSTTSGLDRSSIVARIARLPATLVIVCGRVRATTVIENSCQGGVGSAALHCIPGPDHSQRQRLSVSERSGTLIAPPGSRCLVV